MNSRVVKLYDWNRLRLSTRIVLGVGVKPLGSHPQCHGTEPPGVIKDYYAAGKLDELCNALLNDSLDEDTRRSLGQIHPTFMGEVLPKYRRSEVEIARSERQSTTSDVISPRARMSRLRIKYRLVYEYQTEFGLSQQNSRRPFSLLIVFLDSIKDYGGDPDWHRFWFPLVYNELNLDGGADLETLRDLMSVSSDFYRDLAFYYCRVIDDWYAVKEDLQSEEQQ